VCVCVYVVEQHKTCTWTKAIGAEVSNLRLKQEQTFKGYEWSTCTHELCKQKEKHKKVSKLSTNANVGDWLLKEISCNLTQQIAWFFKA